MKLLRFGPVGAEKPGLLDETGTIRDLSGHVDDINPKALSPETLAQLASIDVQSLPIVDSAQRLGACVSGSPNFHAIGLNYLDHAEETGLRPPREPILFTKSTSCISGPNDDIIIPKQSSKTDWEVELGVVIGTEASYVEEQDALNYIAGYCVINDVSEREWQVERKGQWVKGKSAKSFGPIGPWLVTRDEIPDPNALKLWLEVDGNRHQNGNTHSFIFNVQFIVSYLSQFMVLLPGDIIATGTPAGVGMGMEPQVFLQPGNVVRLGVEGLGEQLHDVVQG